MGACGTSISSNDTYADIYETFFDLYNDGEEVEAISKKLIGDNEEIINDQDDCNNFWFALAKAQWECRQLDPQILALIRDIVESESDLEAWRRLDAEEKDIKKRKVILAKFLVDLQTDRPKAKARKKRVNRQPAFNKGDRLTFELANGNYGGAVVLESDFKTGYGYNLVATTRINQKVKPTKKDFENAEVMVINFAKWEDTVSVRWIIPTKFKQSHTSLKKLNLSKYILTMMSML